MTTTKQKHIRVALVSSIVDIATIYCLWLGQNGWPGIGNIVAFLYCAGAVVLGPIAILGAAVGDLDKLPHRIKWRRCVSISSDIAAALLYAYYGRFVLAAMAFMVLLSTILVYAIVDHRMKKAAMEAINNDDKG